MNKKIKYFTNKNTGNKNIENQYKLIKKYHENYLKEKGVKLSSLNHSGNYSKNALVLIYLSYNYPDTEIVSKNELTTFINHFHPGTADVQQARHLAAQSGWFIDSGTRGDILIKENQIPFGSYKLRTLEETYPNFTQERRLENIDNWEALKKIYNYRCATCGSKENEAHFHWANRTTKLQKGHMDPNKSLKPGNIIPQCDSCNRADKNKWVYDEKGRVRALANPKTITSSSKKVQKDVYKILSNRFKK